MPSRTSPARSLAAPGRSRHARRGDGWRTCRSRRRICPAASREPSASSRRTAWRCHELFLFASRRATAARTASSARMPSRPAPRSSSTPASTPCTTTTERRSQTSATNSAGSRSASPAAARCSRRASTSAWSRGFPIHYFVLARLVPIYRRIRDDQDLRRPFLRLLPRIVVAEWSLGLSACRYVFRRPPVRASAGAGFRTS